MRVFIFIRFVNILCVVINGVFKYGFYEVGDWIRKEVLVLKWNVVYVNGEWCLIDLFWVYIFIFYV